MRSLLLCLVSVVASLSIAACSSTTNGGGTSSSGPTPSSGDGGTGSEASSTADSGTSGALPPASSVEANVDIAGSCPAFAACGGSPQGTYDYTAGCVSDVFATAKQQCPALDASGAKVTVKGSLHFVGNVLTREAVSTTSGSVILPVTCTQGQCAAVESALKSAFDSVTCTGNAACTCVVKRTDTTSDATTFSITGNTLTTADGDSYGICEQGSAFRYQGKSAAAEDGVWELKKR